MNRNILLLLTLAGLTSCAQEPDTLSLWQVHSLRGNILPLTVQNQKVGGFALLSGAFQEADTPGAMNVRIGVYNMYFGTPEAYFSSGSAVIDLMNRTKFDLLLVGVRELYFGPQTFLDLAARAQFPFVSTNLRSKTGELLGPLKTFWLSPGKKWLILNLTPPTILTQNLKSHVQGLSLKADAAALDEVMSQVAEDGKIPSSVLFAGGYLFHPENGPGPELQELLNHPLAQTVVLGAAQGSAEGVYTLSNAKGESRTVISQNSSRLMNGMELESLVISEGKIPQVASLPVTEANFSPDPVMGAPLSDIRRSLEKVMTEPVTRMEAPLTHHFEQESEVGNLMADLFRTYLNTEIFLLNSGTLRSDLPLGPVDKQTLYKLLPFGGNLGKTTILGKDLVKVLEKSFSFIGHPEKGRGFLQVSGLKILRDEGRSTLRILVGGYPLDPERSYSLGSTVYLLSGGDGYSELAAASGSYSEDPTSILTIAIRELKKSTSVKNPGTGRIISP